MSYVEGEGESLGSGARVRIIIRAWVTFTEKIGLPLELGSLFNVRVRERLRFLMLW